MKKLMIAIIMLSAVSVRAEIDTKEQADKFLDDYCVVLVNEIEKASIRRKAQVEEGHWRKVRKTDSWIYGVSEVYANLCGDKD